MEQMLFFAVEYQTPSPTAVSWWVGGGHERMGA